MSKKTTKDSYKFSKRLMQLNGGCDYTIIVDAIYAEVHMVQDVFMNLLFVR